jgi:metal-responsive CopG/Arc/MetJ family transcriptional regulator
MKTAISMDDALLREADETARRLGLSRSRFVARAVSDFLQREREEQMLLRLNEVYAGGLEHSEKRLLRGMKAKIRPTLKDNW